MVCLSIVRHILCLTNVSLVNLWLTQLVDQVLNFRATAEISFKHSRAASTWTHVVELGGVPPNRSNTTAWHQLRLEGATSLRQVVVDLVTIIHCLILFCHRLLLRESTTIVEKWRVRWYWTLVLTRTCSKRWSPLCILPGGVLRF